MLHCIHVVLSNLIKLLWSLACLMFQLRNGLHILPVTQVINGRAVLWPPTYTWTVTSRTNAALVNPVSWVNQGDGHECLVRGCFVSCVPRLVFASWSCCLFFLLLLFFKLSAVFHWVNPVFWQAVWQVCGSGVEGTSWEQWVDYCGSIIDLCASGNHISIFVWFWWQ